MQHRTHSQDAKQGFVLLISLLSLAGVAILITASLTQALTEQRATHTYVNNTMAFHQAEAGLAEALAQLRAGTVTAAAPWVAVDWDGDALANGSNPQDYLERLYAAGTASQLLATGDVQLRIYGWETRTPKVEATGFTPRCTSPHADQTLEVIVEMPQPSILQQGVFGETGINLHSSAVVDSYDSTVGPYTPAPSVWNRAAQGDLRTNSIVQDTVFVDGTVYGGVTVGVGGVPSVVIGGEGYTCGNLSCTTPGTLAAATEPLTLDPVTVPPGVPNAGNFVLGDGGSPATIVLTEGTYWFNRITVGDDRNLVTDGPVTIYCETLSARGANSNIKGRICDGQGSCLDQPSALNVQVLMSANNEPQVDIQGETVFVGTVYAPGRTIRTDGNAVVFGALVAEYVDVHSSGSEMHYDEALKDIPANGGPSTVTIRSWRQLP
jgi:Tfp pilus assembly protein PilX